MALHGDLLAQAKHLAKMERKKPRQSSLRRAVSAAYYALFHFLIDSATRFLIVGSARVELRNRLARSFDHGQMKHASQAFSGKKKNAWTGLVGPPIPADLKTIAETFVFLQQERHEADYDIGRYFLRSEVQATITQAEAAMKLWSSVKNTPAAEAYLLALLIKGRS
jgi:uncharacterized protein (UPF0332 family)